MKTREKSRLKFQEKQKTVSAGVPEAWQCVGTGHGVAEHPLCILADRAGGNDGTSGGVRES